MSIVTLVSGGMDSSLMAVMAKLEKVTQYPLFVDYGQRSAVPEYNACRYVHEVHDLPNPHKMDLSGFGSLISSGLTDPDMDIYLDAFLPGRNMLFLLSGFVYAYQTNSSAVAIGLLSEENHIFPDQTKDFLQEAEKTLSNCTGREIRIIAPLIEYQKTEVIQIANSYNISNTYSCHSGNKEPCGKCIACLEISSSL